MSSAQASTDPSLSHPQASSTTAAQPSGSGGSLSQPLVTAADGTSLQLGGLDSTQLINLLRHLPGMFNKLAEQGQLKEAAAETLSNLSQSSFPAATLPHLAQQIPAHTTFHQHQPALTTHGLTHQHVPTHPVNDPGPSSHPRGPPNLGQLSALAIASNANQSLNSGSIPIASASVPLSAARTDMEDNTSADEEQGGNGASGNAGGSGGRTRGKSATMSQDEWTRQRKDNHKEVERRRRGNINEGINELGRIVPNGTNEKAKGAILSRAVQYIHHLKENEARNIEKWTLEKLLMDQAMGDLQAQLEEMKRMWEDERAGKQRLEAELELLRGGGRGAGAADGRDQSPEGGRRRAREEGNGADGGHGEGGERDGKRQRVE